MRNVVFTGRPALGDDNAMISMFKLDDDGKAATRVNVRLGRVSANSVEIVQGLKPGDRVILTDLSLPDNAERIRIK
jgi:multidrug efflux pump subunit AcrA (membrane-fusion protein)